jgi:nucleoside-diphosphate-sugar epimerase
VSRLAALTGGTGFLGRAILVALRAQGWRVRLLARTEPNHPQLAGGDFEIVRGNLTDADALGRLVSGADAIIHCAGLVKARNRREFMAANAEGAERLAAAAAARAPTSRLVLVSSMAAREPEISPYAASKKAGEDLTIAAAAGMEWLILRPPAIYGPWDQALLPLFRALRLPLVPLFGAAAARIAVIHVEDAAEAIAALAAGGPARQILEISDERPGGYSWREILEQAAAAMNVRPALVPVPGGTLLAAAGLAEAAAFIGNFPAMLSCGKAREMLHADWSANARTLPPEDVWKPRLPLADGLSRTVAWYRAMSWL